MVAEKKYGWALTRDYILGVNVTLGSVLLPELCIIRSWLGSLT